MLRLLATVAVLCLCSPSIADAKWTRLTTAHFEFVGDASERDIRNIAERLELFREVVSRLFNSSATSSSTPTVVMVFQNDRSFTPFKPLFNGKPIELAGVFIQGTDANYIAVNVEQDSDAYGVIFHEYAHFLVANTLGQVPVWLNEGLAEFYQTFESRDGGRSAMIGMPNIQDLQIIQASSSLLPLKTLVSIDHTSPMYNEGDRRGLFYAESWALIHSLMFGGDAKAAQLRRYIGEVAQGRGNADTFTRVFGADTAALERELRQYSRRVGMNALRLDFGERIDAKLSAPAAEIAGVEAAAYLGDLLARTRGVDEGRAYLQKAITGSPDAARASAALGLMELRAGNESAAIPLLEQAIASGSANAAVQQWYAISLLYRARRGGGDAATLYSNARTMLRRVRERQPDNITTTLALVEAEMDDRDAGVPRAIGLLREVVSAAPGRDEYRLMLARALAFNGDYQEATDTIGPVIARPSSDEMRESARELLGQIGNARQNPQTTLDRFVPTPTVADQPRRADAPQGVYQPWLRALGGGETRIMGTFAAVTCAPGVIVLQIDTASGPVRLAAVAFDQIEFLAYRDDAPGSVACGPQTPAFRVLATFRTDAPIGGAGTPNRAVAIELIPDGFTPK